MCDFCKRFDFGSASTETDKYGARIILAGGSYHFPGRANVFLLPCLWTI